MNSIKKINTLFIWLLSFILLLFIYSTPIKADDQSVALVVGGEEYSTLQEAIDNVPSSGVIELKKNITENLILDRDVEFTLNLNDFVINGNKTNRIFSIYKGSITINNGSLENGYLAKWSFQNANYMGGAIYAGNKNNFSSSPEIPINITLNEVIIEDCYASYGGAIYTGPDVTLNINDSRIFNCSSYKVASAIYIAGKNSTLNIANTYVDHNFCEDLNTGSTVAICGNINAENCHFEYNSNAPTTAAYYPNTVINIEYTDDSSVQEFVKCYFENNFDVSEIVHVKVKENNPTLFDNCLFTNNTANRVGAIRLTGGSVKLTDTVITQNTVTQENEFNGAEPTGGIAVLQGSELEFESGAIYNNSSGSVAKDIFIESGSKTNVNILAASEMKDGDFNFDNFAWRDSTGKDYLQTSLVSNDTLTTSSKSYSIRAIIYHDEIATYKDKNYKTIADAVNAANEDYEKGLEVSPIELIDYSNSTDKSILMTHADSVEITAPITINLNYYTLFTDLSDSLFEIKGEDGSLTLTNYGTLNGNINISEEGSLKLDPELHLSGNLNIVTSNLSISPIIGSNGFTVDGNILINITDNSVKQDLSGINTNNSPIQVITGIDESSDLLSKVIISGIDNPNVIKEITNGALTLDNASLKGVFLEQYNDGTSGSTPNDAVGTIKEAIDLLKDDPENNTIFLLGNYNVSGTEEWIGDSADNPINIVRVSTTDDQKQSPMITVNSGALTLENIVIDGNSVETESNKNNINLLTNCGSIIKVNSSGNLIINNGTILQNNDISTTELNDQGDTDRYIPRMGGAIYSTGKVEMNGGTIKNCYALEGGAILIYSRGAEFNMNGGTITDNHSVDTNYLDKLKSSGGGVAIFDDAVMNYKGGEISYNTARYGGGIAVGLGYYSLTSSSDDPNLIIGNAPDNNDSPQAIALDTENTPNILIKENTSNSTGGGIFVQSSYQAFIYEGDIINNHSLSGNFGGGGIYVNGGKSHVENGIVYIKNVLITQNTADGEGGGIAGCPTSRSSFNMIDGEIMYQNWTTKYGQDENGQYRKDDIAVITDDERISYTGPKQENKDDYISSLMLDGTPYHWKIFESGKYATEDYLDSNTGKHLYTDETPTDFSKVRVNIIGNTAATKGGGIGTNGTVIIGDLEYAENNDTTFNVTKNWEGLVQDQDKPEGLTQLNVWLFGQDINKPDDEKLVYITNQTLYQYNPYGDNTWENNNQKYFYNIEDHDYSPVILEEAIFNDQEHYWSNTTNFDNSVLEPYIARIMEVNYGITDIGEIKWANADDAPYTVEISADEDPENAGDFIITNSMNYGSLSFKKVVERVGENINVPEDGFQFKVTLNNANDEPLTDSFDYTITRDKEINTGTIQTGDIVNLYENETILIENIPVGSKYQIEEIGDYDVVYDKEDGSGTITKVVDNTVQTFAITNYFGTPVTSINIPVSKSIVGTPIAVDDFTFSIEASEDNPNGFRMPEDTTLTISGEGVSAFDSIAFTETGTYEFVVTENNTGVPEYSYDSSSYLITIKVEEISDRVLAITEYSVSKSNNSELVQTDISSEQPLEFINTYNILEGDLILTKLVQSSDIDDLNRDFEFSITLNDKTVNGQFNDITFLNGTATTTLKHGETKTIKGLPKDVEYTIVEKDYPEFNVVKVGDTGKIVAGETKTAAFTNTKEDSSEEVVNGALEISKTVVADSVDENQEFTFNINLSEKLSGTYGDITFTEGSATVTLKDGQSVNITDLPTGITYTVSEEEVENYKPLQTTFSGVISENESRCDYINVYTKPEEGSPLIKKEQSSELYDRTSDPIIAKLGETLTYYLTVSNPTDEKLSDITVTDNIPNGLTYVENSASLENVIVNNNSLNWTITDLEAHEEVTLEFEVKVSSTLDILRFENTALMKYLDFNIPSNSVTAYTPIIKLTKSQKTDSIEDTTDQFEFDSSETITYTIKVQNVGEVVATNTVITDPVPEGLDYVTSNPYADLKDNVLTWNLGNVEAGSTINLEVIFKVRNDIGENTRISNIAYASWDEYGLNDPNPSNEVSSTIKTTSTTPTDDNTETPDTSNTTSNSSVNNTTTTTNTASKATSTSKAASPKTGIDDSTITIFIVVIVIAIAALVAYYFINNKNNKKRS